MPKTMDATKGHLTLLPVIKPGAQFH